MPKEIKKSGTVVSKYTYLSDGSKVSSCDADGNGYMYFGTARFTLDNEVPTFESIPFSGGRIVKTTNGYEPQYYLTDHLGSTRAIVNKDGQTVEATFDYTPFGVQIVDSQMPTNSTEYRFSGKELQNISDYEIYDFGARQYFPKYAIWSSVDPLSETYYPITPYAYCLNNPVGNIDPDGNIVIPIGSAKYKQQFQENINYMRQNGTASGYDILHKSEKVYVVQEMEDKSCIIYRKVGNAEIRWSPDIALETDNGHTLSPATVLAHEFEHGVDAETNFMEYVKNHYTNDDQYRDKNERDVITNEEQDIAKAHGDIKEGEVTRTNHKGYYRLIDEDERRRFLNKQNESLSDRMSGKIFRE